MKYTFKEHKPEVGTDVFIAPTAVIIGQVTLRDRASVWFNSVLRGDINSIEIGEDSNIQDSCTLHVTEEYGVIVKERVTVGHGVILHGCVIEPDCLIAMGAVVLDGARVSRGSIVAAGAIVSPNTEIPPDSLAMGIPAKVVRKLHEKDRERFSQNWKNYTEYSRIYLDEANFRRI